jgi:uncharacterized membrane protein
VSGCVTRLRIASWLNNTAVLYLVKPPGSGPARTFGTVAHDPLDLPATTRRVRAVARAATLSAPALERGLALATETPDPRAWGAFLSRALALLGAGLVLSGVVCFVAYNWDRVGRFGKFALIELAIVGATLVAWRKLPRITGQVALLGAAVLVGPLLGVFGQTYQTGADPYGLFLTWLLVILPWVIVSRFTALWVIALVLLDTSIVLYWTQVVGVRDARSALYLPIVVATIHFAAIAAWEWQYRRAQPWLAERWAPRLVAVFGFFGLWLPAVIFAVADAEAGLAGALGFAGLAAAIAVTLHYYRRVRSDLLMVTDAVTFGMAFVTAVVGRVVFKVLELDALGLFVMAAFVIWQITLGLAWFRRSRNAS